MQPRNPFRIALLLCAIGALTASALGQPVSPASAQVGTASWYGAWHAGRVTASGTVFNPDSLTAANKSLPLGTCVHVTNLANERSVTVRITDRGPYVRGRLIDLSRAAAHAVGMKRKGVAPVRIQPVSSCSTQIAMEQDNASGTR